MILNYIMAQAAAAADSLAHKVSIDAAMSSISALTVEEIVKYLTSAGLTIGATIIKVAFIWIIGRWLSKRLVTLVKKLMVKKNTDASIQTFLVSLIDIVALIVLLIIIISVVGIDTSSFIALFASAGVAIGMALSGTLQNFAGGVMVLLFRPYKVGDYIEASTGASGTVTDIQIFHTVLTTPDNKVIYAPNGAMSSAVVTNYNRKETRRLNFTFGVEYGTDFDHVKAIILEVINKDSRILKDPAPFVELGALADSSVNITVRIWVNAADYWSVNFDMNKNIYATFNEKGISFPFPQLTVHQA